MVADNLEVRLEALLSEVSGMTTVSRDWGPLDARLERLEAAQRASYVQEREGVGNANSHSQLMQLLRMENEARMAMAQRLDLHCDAHQQAFEELRGEADAANERLLRVENAHTEATSSGCGADGVLS